jgi:hypothetical protein
MSLKLPKIPIAVRDITLLKGRSVIKIMGEITIHTDAGELKLVRASQDEFMPVAINWPMGVAFSREADQPYGLIFQMGEEEALGVKLQPPDCDEETARTVYLLNQAVIASALPFYLKHQHPGIILPCPYFKEKAGDRFESGIAFFVAPRPVDSPRHPTENRVQLDDRLGDGASRMISDFMAALVAGASRFNLPITEVLIGIDVRPRMALGSIGMPFLVHGPNLFATQYPLRDNHPFWEFTVRAGFSRLSYAPIAPSAVPGSPNVPHGWLERVKHFARR